MTIAQFNNEMKMPTPFDHVKQGEKVLEAALELVKAGFRVFPVHGIRWVRVVVPVGAATAVPGGDIRGDGNGTGREVGKEQEEELEVRWRVEMRCTCGVVSCANIGKHPVGGLVPHGSKEASGDEFQVKKWFFVPDMGTERGKELLEKGWVPWNLAVATGNGLVVIDAEARQLKAELPTGLDVLDNWEEWTRGARLPVAAGEWQNTITFEPDETGELVVKVVSTGDLAPAPMGGVERQGYWPGTLRVRTGSGGLHVYVRVDENLRIKSRNRVLPAVDIKADGGYVLAPPSRHASGGVYVIEEGRYALTGAPGTVGKADDSLVNWLLSVRGNTYSVRRLGDTTGGMPDDYDFLRIFANGCPAGFRDYFINDLCFRLRRKGLSYEDAAATLRQQWNRMEQPADSVYAWDTCIYKIRRVWSDVTPEDQTELPAWRPPAQGQMEQVKAIGPTAADAIAATVDETATIVIAPAAITGEISAAPVPLISERGLSWADLDRRDLTMLLTDTGNAMRYAQRMREMVRYSPDIDKWFAWDGMRWAPDNLGKTMLLTKEIVKDLYAEATDPTVSETDQVSIQRWADTSQSVARRQAMLVLAKAEPGISLESKDLDANPDQLVVLNGTLELRTGKLRVSAAEDLNTMRANVVYDPTAQCPKWMGHLNFVTGGAPAFMRYLQRVAGYCLTGHTQEQKLFFLHGDGENGKNTFVETLAALLGDYAQAADQNFLSGSDEHSTQIAGLRGKRLVYADETEKNRKIKESRVKTLTGSKTLTARYMRQNFFEFTPRFKLVIMGNAKPPIDGRDNGIWRRLKLVPFTQVLEPGQKVLGYEQELLEELPGILNWALQGAQEWYRFQDLGEVEEVTVATAAYREDEDEEAEFFAERVIKCEEKDGGVMIFNEVFMEYRLWCGLVGVAKEDMISKKAFAQELERRGYTRPKSAKRVQGYATQKRVWIGGRLRTHADADIS